MKNLENVKFQELSNQEAKDINGGIVCGGWCIAGLVVLAVGALGLGAYNGYQSEKDKHEGVN